MLYFYVFLCAAIIPLLDRLGVPILRQSYSIWLVPLIFFGGILICIILHFLSLFLVFGFVNIKKERKPCSGFCRKYVASTLTLFFKVIGVRIYASGLEKIPENESFLLVCNHIHPIDPAIFLSLMPEVNLRFIAKKEVYSTMPFVAKALHKLGGLPIDRENNREGAKTIIKAINIIKHNEGTIGIFPEGYTSRDGELHGLRNGSLKIATKSGCKIAVCTLTNTPLIFKNIFRRRTDVYLNVAEVLTPDEFGGNTNELGEKVHAIMQKSIESEREKCKKSQ